MTKRITTTLAALMVLFSLSACGRCGDFIDSITGVQDADEVLKRWEAEDAARGYRPSRQRR